MIRLCIFQAVLICSMLAAYAGSATAAGFVTCVDDAGRVSYGDRPCQGSDGDTVSDSRIADPVVRRIAPATEKYAAAEQEREAAAARKRAGRAPVSRDLATLGAAKKALVLLDVAESQSRQQKIAVLELKEQSWFRF